ncbi:tRNA threonylcarbamoyladenosine biosynthesis protein TsaB [Litorivivens lipolytica]|uniref:tRNA threonylcarbamoyladenosine biosynthesis protein TsaB n=1 Tax=Litorivivens lipolytica TaxID=1524264 RepID=A0A7W4W231_9GAMM|nr:tRNA (adenosine(37)-N6)-threonylcarbamoyltransferase complex dimerization subunit type 1 TsaB [Litorivivens lipolytica]MBB3046015.1 tRNA threonylcarbamoyladenosine biosynthesis protein TsaB [Litorivivens lipolytica]
MATLLAIETSADACSLALLRQGELLEKHEILPKSHTQHILPMVDALLAEGGLRLSALDGIAFGRGPGSFTGLRVCAAVVQGLALASELPCIPVSSLQALAQTAKSRWSLADGEVITSCVDARMDEIYWCQYRVVNGIAQAFQTEQLSAPEAMLPGEQAQYVVGSGLSYGDRLSGVSGVQDAELLARGGAVAELGAVALKDGNAVSVEQAIPSYLRDDVAWR